MLLHQKTVKLLYTSHYAYIMDTYDFYKDTSFFLKWIFTDIYPNYM